MYFETVLDVLRHHPYSEVTTAMIQLVSSTIKKNIPTALYENSVSRVIRSENLRERPQNQQVIAEAITINFDSVKVMNNLHILFECIKLSQRIIAELHETIPESEIALLIIRLEECNKMAASFNEDILLRMLLWKNGYNAKSPLLPSLYRNEKMTTDSMLLHLKKLTEQHTLEKEEGRIHFKSYVQ